MTKYSGFLLHVTRKMAVGCALAGLILFSAGCDMEYNHVVQDDENANSEYVYGDPDGPARQTKNQYPTDPKDVARANEIRKKWFGDVDGGASDGNGSGSTTTTAADSTQADSTKATN